MSCILSAGTSAAQGAAAGKPAGTPDEIHKLWAEQVTPLLQKPIPTESEPSYYAGEMLQIPLHAAFKLKDAGWQQEFADYFQRVMQARSTLTDVTLSRLQFLYLSSEFVVLANESGQEKLVPPGLVDFLFSDVRDIWLRQPAVQYARKPFNGMRERVLWKLNTRSVEKSYYRAIQDVDLYLFAVAADLRADRGRDVADDRRKLLNDILDVADRVFRQEVTHNDNGGWILQPGVMTDHPDNKYAGRTTAQANMSPAPVPGISWDSSHSLRFPLWLTSLMKAYAPGSSENQFYADLRAGLARQFFSRVLVPPSAESPCYRTNNYMDGHNGVYRWEYKNIGTNNGYRPYQASGALVIGWWSFLDTDQSRSLYKKLADQFPWPQECVDWYLGPAPNNRVLTKAERDPRSRAMMLRYLEVKLASQL